MISLILALLLHQGIDNQKEYQSIYPAPPVNSYKVIDYCSLKDITCEENIEEIIERVCQENGFTEVEKLKRIASCESSNDPKVKNPNPNSSATGLFQFTKGTWQDGCKQLGVDWDLEDRKDVEKSTVMTIHFIGRGEISRWNETRHCWR